ncbi:hypothetical protein NQ317_006502, partial [Molorchus minor]
MFGHATEIDILPLEDSFQSSVEGDFRINTVREWKFRSERFLDINNQITEEDKKLFPMSDFHRLPMEEYMRRAVLGTRQYCMKEDLSSLPRCRRKQK